MLVVACLMFGALLLVNMEKNENGNWGIVTASAQDGENDGGERKVHTTYDIYDIGTGCPTTIGVATEVTISYIGTFCCA